VIGLTGELGAGKTQLVKGLARGLGFRGAVHSPSFALVNEYLGGRLPLFHLDLYRLDTVDQIVRAGLEELIPPRDGVTVVEWAEKWFDAAPADPAVPVDPPHWLRRVRLDWLTEMERRIVYEDLGA
jgi:tRNA threonylcarbamoyladenosine biosynthesis protein TsaE